MSDLILTPPAPPPPVERSCGTCRWFRWATGPTGRKRPTHAGQCKWPIPWPSKWPDAYRFNRGCGPDGNPYPPAPQKVWRYSGTRCQCWEAKP